jgi:hypothetical protein
VWSAHLLCCCVKCEQSSWHPLHTQKETLSELRVLTFGDPIHTQKETTLSELRVLTCGECGLLACVVELHIGGFTYHWRASAFACQWCESPLVCTSSCMLSYALLLTA